MRAAQTSGVEPERLDKASIQGVKAEWSARTQDRTGQVGLAQIAYLSPLGLWHHAQVSEAKLDKEDI